MTTMPMPPKSRPRIESPRSRRSIRFRAAQNDGRSKYGKAASDLIDLLQAAATRQLQEHRREMLVARSARNLLDLVNRPLRDDASLLNDAHAVTHLLRDFERMRTHEDGDAALAHAAEDVLDQPRAARVESHHRL